MKAMRYHRYGSPDVIQQEEVERPVLRAGQVRVRVLGAAANPYDWHFVRGEPYFMRLLFGLRAPRRPTLGVDFAGVVEDVAPDTTTYRPGDEVYGMADGAFAEYVCAEADEIAHKPRNLGFDRAAAVPLAALTALQGLREGGALRQGERVLIVGASGGVGTFAVQLAARLFGAHVTGICSGKNIDLVRALGADEVFDYTRHDFTASSEKYDVILQLGGAQSPWRCRRALTPRGRLVLSSGDSDGRWLGPLTRVLQAVALSPFVKPQRLLALDVKRSRADLHLLAELIDAGALSPVIERSFSFEQVPDAIRYVEGGGARGKVLVSFCASPRADDASST